jgi:2-polyprenyl-3-methyl-5-hydroxy-6-metoxy-1,4-benzoquinol methylase
MNQQIEFENVDCLVCEGAETVPGGKIRWRGTDFRYVLCKRCGLKYMNPRPTLAWYRRFYEEEFWQEKVTNKGFKFRERQTREEALGIEKKLKKQQVFAERIFDIVSGAVPLDSTRTVLEIGASWGATLKMLRDKTGCRVLAVEPSAIAREHMRVQFDIPLIGYAIEDLAENDQYDGEVDVVIFSHVLENIIDPIQALDICHRLLRDSGAVYIDTCNFYYNDAMNPYHPYIFSPETLQGLLARAGFEILQVHCDQTPPQEALPTDLYLKVIARKSNTAPPGIQSVDVEGMLANQKIGLARIRSAQTGSAKKTGLLARIFRR